MHRILYSFVLFGYWLTIALAASPWSSRAAEPEKLPWETNYATAREKAISEKRPMFVMMTATWCGPCKMLESETLPNKMILEGLKEFVWVQAFEDKEVEAKYGCNGYPTLAFVDPASDKVLFKTSGYRPVGPFLKSVIDARKGAGLELSERLERLAAKVFSPDWNVLKDLIEKGDGAGIKKYLEPVEEDELRDMNYLVVKLVMPEDVPMSHLVEERLIGNRHAPDSGILIAPFGRSQKEVPINFIAPGCKSLSQSIRIPAGKAVVFQKLEMKKLERNDAVRFVGTVVLPSGQPAEDAIVRICDWEVTRTDSKGEFRFDAVSPGRFLVRAEYPGGEYHRVLEFGKRKIMKEELKLTPVTTVGIRWARQTTPGSRRLVGDGVETGFAYFSVQHSRFLLDRGAEVRNYNGSDFMLQDDVENLKKYMAPAQAQALSESGSKVPFFWLFDSNGRNGLHEQEESFDSIEEVSEAAMTDRGQKYFEFLRGRKVEVGSVFTVRCCSDECYAKLEISSVDPPVAKP